MVETHFIASQKISKFRTIKNTAGKETHTLSFILIRTIKPHSISKLRPKEDNGNNGLYFNPSNKPVAPKN